MIQVVYKSSSTNDGDNLLPQPQDQLRHFASTPCYTLLSTIEYDLSPVNIGVSTANHQAPNWQSDL